jgi:NAD(P)-dependent dehydrogenase (short-subunit alcohol dehydrogenase family)
VVVSSRDQVRVESAVARLGASAEGFAANLTDEVATRDLFERIGPFDHLAFTAGETLQLQMLAEISMPAARQFFETRYWGALTAAKFGAPLIRAGGSIVFTSGIAGARPQAGWALGASITAAMEGLTRALAVELAPVRVNIVSPGFVRTPLWHGMPAAERETMYAAVGAKLPVGRVGEAAELAESFVFLMRQGFATGQTFIVDGGGVLV